MMKAGTIKSVAKSEILSEEPELWTRIPRTKLSGPAGIRDATWKGQIRRVTFIVGIEHAP